MLNPAQYNNLCNEKNNVFLTKVYDQSQFYLIILTISIRGKDKFDYEI
jgi:hypothetical protein